ncbi:MAG: HAD family phosphatase [Bryobacteraceae bacterium]|nr:HAD family phosphatase [Bryobacteraceae bacterium]
MLAYILDMDGVVIHSTPLHNQAWLEYLRRHGIHRDLKAVEAAMLGKHNADIVRGFFGDGLTDDEIFRHGAAKEVLYRGLMAPRLAEFLVPGVVDFCRRTRHVPIGLASNAEPANVRFILEGAGLLPYFKAVLDAAQVSHPKPDPEIYLRTAEALGATPSECVIFEDSDVGVRAARAAGAGAVIGVSTTTPRLDGADFQIANFLDARLDVWLGRLARG